MKALVESDLSNPDGLVDLLTNLSYARDVLWTIQSSIEGKTMVQSADNTRDLEGELGEAISILDKLGLHLLMGGLKEFY